MVPKYKSDRVIPLLYILQWRYTRTPDKLLLGKKTEPWDTETYFLGIHMYSVWRKKMCRYSVFKTKPLPQKSFYGFSLPWQKGCCGAGRKSLVPNALCGVATPYWSVFPWLSSMQRDSQQIHEKMFNITNQEMQAKTLWHITSHLLEWL